MTAVVWVAGMGTLAAAGVLAGALLPRDRRGGYPAPMVERIEIPKVPDEPEAALPCGCRPSGHTEAIRRLAAVMRDRPHRE